MCSNQTSFTNTGGASFLACKLQFAELLSVLLLSFVCLFMSRNHVVLITEGLQCVLMSDGDHLHSEPHLFLNVSFCIKFSISLIGYKNQKLMGNFIKITLNLKSIQSQFCALFVSCALVQFLLVLREILYFQCKGSQCTNTFYTTLNLIFSFLSFYSLIFHFKYYPLTQSMTYTSVNDVILFSLFSSPSFTFKKFYSSYFVRINNTHL